MTDDLVIAQLRLHEGWRSIAYMDTVGKITIGCGRNLSDVGLSDAEIRTLLDHDLDAVIADLDQFPWFARLDAIRQRVLIDFRFNLGPERFRGFRSFLAAMDSGDTTKAAKAMRDSLWFRQVGARAVRLQQMLLTGMDYTI